MDRNSDGGLRSLEGKLLVLSLSWLLFVVGVFPALGSFKAGKCRELAAGAGPLPGDFLDRCQSVMAGSWDDEARLLLLASCLLMVGMAAVVYRNRVRHPGP